MLARFVYKFSPKGKCILAEQILRLSVGDFVWSVYGVRLKKNWKDATFRYCINGLYGKYFSNFILSYKNNYSFIDIGANQGLYSLIASQNPSVFQIYAFEPNLIICDLLSANARLNKVNLNLIPAAISSIQGSMAFHYDKFHTGSGKIVEHNTNMVVNCRDYSVFDEIQLVDILPKIVKIDVEGHEPIVIQQLLKSNLINSVHYIFFEVNEERFDISNLKLKLQSKGFYLLHRTFTGIHYELMYGKL